jgi:hypothetical protein
MKTKEELDQITKDYEDAKGNFIEATYKYLETFSPLSDEDEEESLQEILELMP